jgi:hypothetical protein
MAHYCNPGMLERHYELLAGAGKAISSHVSLTVVDDCSPDDLRPPLPPKAFPIRTQIFRFTRKINWNQDAARNLAVAHSTTRWVLLTDIDHLVPLSTLHHLASHDVDPEVAYKFHRVSEPDMMPYKQHPNSWFMTREMYDRAGGYDERWAGVYGTDGAFATRVRAAARGILDLKLNIIRVPREVTPDASTSPKMLTRKSPENDELKEKIKARIDASGEYWPVRYLTPWEKVY